MPGDCAANHIKHKGKVVIDCFVINVIWQNTELWKANGKINDSVNVTYYALTLKYSKKKVGSNTKTILAKS